MNGIYLTSIVWLAIVAPVIVAETTDRTQSILDANPVCMDRKGQDCVLRSEVMPLGRGAPPVTPPTGVVVIPQPPPPGTIAVIGATVPAGVTGSPEVIVVPVAGSTAPAAPGATGDIAPAAPVQPSAITLPRR